MSILAFFGINIGGNQPANTEVGKEPAVSVSEITESVTVTFYSNPSTGYHWEYKVIKGCAELKEENFIYTAPEGVVGAGGTSEYVFNNFNEGENIIRFYQYAPGNQTVPAAFFTVVIEKTGSNIIASILE